ncbi:MAG: hypothetical protein H6907_21485 [Hyphomicrobiales bacterium]|nr:hypothetical protein [Hyphomicrobiales bacterium]MCP5374317.1 hypothetical protein [Hyphomicrobiales bacterium]
MKGTGGWGCPHESDGTCGRVRGRDCDPGMKGCILSGRFSFASDDKNRRPKPRRRPPPAPDSDHRDSDDRDR